MSFEWKLSLNQILSIKISSKLKKIKKIFMLVWQKEPGNLVTKKSSLAFKVEVIILHHLKLPFWMSNNPRELGQDDMLSEATFLPVLRSHADTSSVLQNEELLHWSFHLLLIVEASRVQEVNHGFEQLGKLGPDYMLGVASLWTPQVPGVYSGN